MRKLLTQFATNVLQELRTATTDLRCAVYVSIREREMRHADFELLHDLHFEYYHARAFDRLHHTGLDHQAACAPAAAPTKRGTHLDANALKAKHLRAMSNVIPSGSSIVTTVAPQGDETASNASGGSSAFGGFRFAPEFVYYAWVGLQPAVPPYATSTEGVVGLVFSPIEAAADGDRASAGAGGGGGDASGSDGGGSGCGGGGIGRIGDGGKTAGVAAVGSKLLLVWERGCWSMPGGAVECGEPLYDGLRRETIEEVGAELDDAFAPVYLGGTQVAAARDLRINDVFSVLAVRATSEAVKTDELEIADARWLPWNGMYAAWTAAVNAAAGRSEALGKHFDVSRVGELDCLEEGKRKVSLKVMAVLHAYLEGRGLPCVVERGSSGMRKVAIGALTTALPAMAAAVPEGPEPVCPVPADAEPVALKWNSKMEA